MRHKALASVLALAAAVSGPPTAAQDIAARPGPIAFERFDHIGFGVKDLDASIAWWRDHFGFEREVDFEVKEIGARAAFIRRGDTRIEMFAFQPSVPVPENRRDALRALKEGTLHHIALRVADVPAALAELQRRGVEVAFPLSQGPFGPYAFVKDNSGNFVELYAQSAVVERERQAATARGQQR